MHARDPGMIFVLALAPTLAREAALGHVRTARLPEDLRLELVEGRTWEAVRAADVALAKPGTVALEVALLGRPLVTAGRANALSAAIARRVVRLPSWTMPNLILGAPVVPEFLQEQARPERVAAALAQLLEGPARELQLARLARLRERLGGGGAAERTAEIALGMLREGTGRP
jgi:lipid-A-disaccharide synthase